MMMNTTKKDIRLLVMDVDGTLTDGKIYMGDTGEIVKAFDVKDGYAIHNILPAYGILPAIITGRYSNILKKRCEELKIQFLYQNIKNKLEQLDCILSLLQLSYEQVAYIGDDINDIDCMKKVGIVGCPSDAVEPVKAISDFISEKSGGQGAVRQFIDWLLT